MKILVKITKDVLEQSMHCTSNKIGQNCAIGKAIFNLFGNISWVAATSILFRREGIDNVMQANSHEVRVKLPIEAVIFINKFDSSVPRERAKLEPISFEIDVPMEVIEWIDISHAYKVLSESKTLELITN